MKTNTLLALSAGSILLFSACGNSNTAGTNGTATTDTVKSVPLPPVSLAMVSASPDYKDASISVSAKGEKNGKDSTKVTFTFEVKNYELKMQTTDNGNKMCNNSAQGQHIHFILDNSPYKALYEPKNEVVLANDGKEHFLMAFLSRSYHESIKSKGAALVYHFKIDDKGNLKKLEDPKMPMVFYSRPKGDYVGKDTTNVLLDYYVWNCTLATDGYKVKAEIANENRESQKYTTTLDKWEPNFIQNLGTGKGKVILTLLDKDGKPADGPMTTITREFNLKAQ